MSETPLIEYWMLGCIVLTVFGVPIMLIYTIAKHPGLAVDAAILVVTLVSALAIPTAVGYWIDWWLFDG